MDQKKYPHLSAVLAKDNSDYSNQELVEMINKEAAKKDSKKLEKLRDELAFRKIHPAPTVEKGKAFKQWWEGTRYVGMPLKKAKSVAASTKGNVIFQTPDENYRILEIPDDSFTMEDLKGETYDRKVNPTVPEDQMAQEEKDFEQLVNDNGVYGYVLEKWDPAPGKGYVQVDSCWGFVGQYNPNDENFNHYIVDELKSQIPQEAK